MGQNLEQLSKKLDALWANFVAGIEPLVRGENDRRFMGLSEKGQKRVIAAVLAEARGDRQTAAAIIYCDFGVSQKLAEQLVK